MTIYQVDSFAERPFAGNPAGVCVLPGPADEQWMQSLAMEMNLSETAFLHRADGGWNLRWFTPETEVDLCGHATLAAAHILWETRRLQRNEKAEFHTKSGNLYAKYQDERIILNFPAIAEQPLNDPSCISRALGAPAVYAGMGTMDYIVELGSEDEVLTLKPDMAALAGIGSRGVIVTARSSAPGCDFVSRFFAPAVGIPEDPVTGSAHCCLGPYWMKRLGKSSFTAYQASKRGGWLTVDVLGDRVYIGGKAVTVFRIEMPEACRG